MAPGKSPAFSFYTKDFLSGTAKMSLQEVGAYIRLLSYAWDDGSIPNDADERARLMVCSKTQERDLWTKVGKKFVLRDDAYVNERMEDERAKQVERRRRLADNGKLGGRPSKANEKLNETKRLSEQEPNENLDKRLAFSSSSSKELKNKNAREARSVRFDEWYSAYPKKVGKGAALTAWQKIRPDDAQVTRMLAALQWQRRQPQWTNDGGKFIPNPASYLNAARWEDEPFFTEPSTRSSVPSPEETSRMLAEREAMAGK